MQMRDDGVSEVVGFILILALIIVVVAIWGVYTSSAEGAEQESENSIHILEQMSDLKYGMDLLWEANGTGMNTTGVQRSMMFSLYPDMMSDAFLPGMDIYPGSGTLRVVPSDTRITIKNDDSIPSIFTEENISMLEYVTSYNYAEDIVMSLNLGAVSSHSVLSGSSPSSILLPPIGNGTEGPLVVLPVLYVPEGNTTSISGNGIVALDYNLASLERRPFLDNVTITFDVKDKDSVTVQQWKQMLKVSNFQPDQADNKYQYEGSGNIIVARYEIILRAVI